MHRCDDLGRESHVRGAGGRGRLPKPLRAHRTGGRQRLVHAPDAEHEPDPLRRRVRRDDRVGAAARRLDVHARARRRASPCRTCPSAASTSAGARCACRRPVFAGDTIRAETEVLAKRESKSRPGLRHRHRPHARPQPARRGRDRVRALDHAAAVIETERLLLRRPTAADVEDPPAFLTDPGSWSSSAASTRRRSGRACNSGSTAGRRIRPGSSSSRRRPASGSGGSASTSTTRPAGRGRASPDARPELTWALAYEHWGKGYATEAAAAVRDWLRQADQISLIAPLEHPLAAGRAAARRDARRDGGAAGGGPHVVWEHPAVIETERLLLRKPRLEDAPGLARRVSPIPRRCAFIGDGSTADLAGAEEASTAGSDAGRRGASACSRSSAREDGRVLGRAGFLRWDPETWEIGGSRDGAAAGLLAPRALGTRLRDRGGARAARLGPRRARAARGSSR